MRDLPARHLKRLRTFTAYCTVASGFLFAIGCFLPAVGIFKGEEPINGIWALLLGWLHLLPLISPDYRENIGQNFSQNEGAVWIANLFVPIAIYFLFHAPRDFKSFAVVFAAVGTALATRAFTVFGYEDLWSGFYFWLASFAFFTAGTTGAVACDLSFKESPS